MLVVANKPDPLNKPIAPGEMSLLEQSSNTTNTLLSDPNLLRATAEEYIFPDSSIHPVELEYLQGMLRQLPSDGRVSFFAFSSGSLAGAIPGEDLDEGWSRVKDKMSKLSHYNGGTAVIVSHGAIFVIAPNSSIDDVSGQITEGLRSDYAIKDCIATHLYQFDDLKDPWMERLFTKRFGLSKDDLSAISEAGIESEQVKIFRLFRVVADRVWENEVERYWNLAKQENFVAVIKKREIQAVIVPPGPSSDSPVQKIEELLDKARVSYCERIYELKDKLSNLDADCDPEELLFLLDEGARMAILSRSRFPVAYCKLRDRFPLVRRIDKNPDPSPSESSSIGMQWDRLVKDLISRLGSFGTREEALDQVLVLALGRHKVFEGLARNNFSPYKMGMSKLLREFLLTWGDREGRLTSYFSEEIEE